uniref:Uncharacterized protein n=1 Tax=Cyprinus carpio TaxID=7962 RepID=A0A8C2FXT5_CYPCA
LDLVLKIHDDKVVSFGQRDGIRVGYAVLSINGVGVNMSIRFGRPRLTSNEKLMLKVTQHGILFDMSLKKCNTLGIGIHSEFIIFHKHKSKILDKLCPLFFIPYLKNELKDI